MIWMAGSPRPCRRAPLRRGASGGRRWSRRRSTAREHSGHDGPGRWRSTRARSARRRHRRAPARRRPETFRAARVWLPDQTRRGADERRGPGIATPACDPGRGFGMCTARLPRALYRQRPEGRRLRGDAAHRRHGPISTAPAPAIARDLLVQRERKQRQAVASSGRCRSATNRLRNGRIAERRRWAQRSSARPPKAAIREPARLTARGRTPGSRSRRWSLRPGRRRSSTTCHRCRAAGWLWCRRAIRKGLGRVRNGGQGATEASVTRLRTGYPEGTGNGG